MSDVETLEVPITRVARVTLAGRLTEVAGDMFIYEPDVDGQWLSVGCQIALRSRAEPGSPWRNGTTTVTDTHPGGWIIADLSRIPSAAVWDYVYRVEPA